MLTPGAICQACGGHLLSEAIGLLLVLGQLHLPLLDAAVGLLQRRHQLGIAVLQGEELSLQVDLTHGPDDRTGGGTSFRAFPLNHHSNGGNKALYAVTGKVLRKITQKASQHGQSSAAQMESECSLKTIMSL